MALPSSSPLHKALFGRAAGQSKCLIYTFLHGEFKPKNFQKLKEKWTGGIHKVLCKVQDSVYYCQWLSLNWKFF